MDRNVRLAIKPAWEDNVAIRKYGKAEDQEVTEVQQDGITKEAAQEWTPADDRDLAAENRDDPAYD